MSEALEYLIKSVNKKGKEILYNKLDMQSYLKKESNLTVQEKKKYSKFGQEWLMSKVIWEINIKM